LVDAIPAVAGKRGRPRRRLERLLADRGYDFDRYRRALRSRGICPQIARRGVMHGSGLGRLRWVVERSLSWLHQFKRLRVRWEYRADSTMPSSSSPAAWSAGGSCHRERHTHRLGAVVTRQDHQPET
jgi:transposase